MTKNDKKILHTDNELRQWTPSVAADVGVSISSIHSTQNDDHY